MNPRNPSACNPMGHAVNLSTGVKILYVSLLLQLQSAFTLDTKLGTSYSVLDLALKYIIKKCWARHESSVVIRPLDAP